MNLSPETMVDVFDKLITPVLCYAAEVWGFHVSSDEGMAAGSGTSLGLACQNIGVPSGPQRKICDCNQKADT